jgi:dihydrofolate synthase / folylpolyglutamate synthase
MFTTVQECLDWIYEPRQFERRLDLARVEQAMALFGDPVNYPCIHVGGTNGKGSTVTYLRHILQEAGYKVGAYISPFVVVFNERISINHSYISDADVIRLTNHMKHVLTINHHPLTNFEIITIMSFLYFEDQQVDVAVIEVGLGGLLDATNVIQKDVAVITNIGTDHAEILGDTKELIGFQKLGIVHDALITSIDDEMAPQFERYCKQRRAYMKRISAISKVNVGKTSTTFTYDGEPYTISILGQHQASNAALAIETMKYLIQYKKYKVTQEHIQQGLKKAFWPGRLERLNEHVMIDGAHNREGIQALVHYIQTLDEQPHIIFGVLEKKPYEKMLAMLAPVASKLTLTTFDYPGSMPAEELRLAVTHDKVEVVKDSTIYFANQHSTIYCGSLYFISQIRSAFFSK